VMLGFCAARKTEHVNGYIPLCRRLQMPTA
jgi:hypothetical protein